MIALENKTGLHFYAVLAAQLPGQLRFFLAGALVAAHQYIFVGTRPRVTLGIVASGVLGILYFGGPLTLYPALLALVVLSFCLIGPKLGSWLVYGDLSYGIYIVHFPVLQAIKSLGVLENRQGLLFVLTTVSVFSLAALLWHFIENFPHCGVVGSKDRLRKSPRKITQTMIISQPIMELVGRTQFTVGKARRISIAKATENGPDFSPMMRLNLKIRLRRCEPSQHG